MKKINFTPSWKIIIYFLSSYVILSSIIVIIYVSFQVNAIYEQKGVQIQERTNAYLELLNRGYSEEEAENYVTGLRYTIHAYDNIEIINNEYQAVLSSDEIERINNGESVLITRRYKSKIITPITIVKYDGKYHVLSEITQVTPILIIAQEKNIASYYLTIIIGLGIILYFIAKSQKPIEKLAEGLNEISHGNYDIIIENRSKDKHISGAINNFNNLAVELKKNSMQMQNILSTVSHEIKTPMSIIKGYSELLIKDSSIGIEERNKFLHIINEECARLTELTSNILYATALKGKKLIETKKNIRVDELIRKAILLFRKNYEAKNINLNVNIYEISLTSNEELLYHAIINILDNAIKYTSDNGTINITARRKRFKVYLEFEDSGMGIPVSEKEKIFDQFFIGSNNSNGNSSGLGLYIVNQVIKLLKGEIIVYSELGKGTKFTLIL